VGLLSRLFGEAVKRIEASPRYQAVAEAHERTAPFESAAQGLAYSTLSDEEACARLREWIGAVDEVVQEAVESSARSRRSYAYDRAYRLLSAAADSAPVQPVDPACAALFREEENVGRLPLDQAFDLLAAREPKLAELRAEAASQATTQRPDARWKSYRERNGQVIHVLREHRRRADDPLLGTLLAQGIAMEYLRVIADVGPPRDLTESYFDDLANTDLGERPRPAATC
jgi:hypothetical protein